MTISIALATCNGSLYLRQQLQSILHQNRQPDQLVISDDASDDNTLQLVRSVLSEASFPLTIRANPERLGAPANFSEALRCSRGDIVALSDQDDVWFPHKLERIEAEFSRRPDLAVLINDAIIADAALRTAHKTRIQQIRSGLYSLEHHVQGSCTSLRGSLLQHLLPVPSKLWTHDSWIHSVGHLLGVRAILSEPLQYFRRHGSNESNSPTSSVVPLTTRRSLAGKFRRNILHPPSRQAMIEQELEKTYCLLSWWERNSPQLKELPYVDADLAMANVRLLRDKAEIARERIQAMRRSRLGRFSLLAPLYLRKGRESYGGRVELTKDLIIR